MCLGSGEVRRLDRKDSSAFRCCTRLDEEREKDSKFLLRKLTAVKWLGSQRRMILVAWRASSAASAGAEVSVPDRASCCFSLFEGDLLR